MADRDIGALIAFIDGRQNVPHSWGRDNGNDCVGFSLAAVEAQTRERVAPELNWSSFESALRVLQQFGSLEAAYDTFFDRVAPSFAKRGDIAFAPPAPVRGDIMAYAPDGPFALHPMIVEGALLVGPGDRGNERVSRSAMICAWSAESRRR